MLQAVTGDFSVEVKVSCDLNPQHQLPRGSLAYHGSGLLVWADPTHFLRVERNAYWLVSEKAHYSFVPSIEYVRAHTSSRAKPRSPGIGFHQRHTWLRVVRRGSKVTSAISHDGQKWEEPIESDVTLPERVWVGVAAVNYSLDELAVEFTDFKLTNLAPVKPPQ